jgi:hypothetical protein
MIPVPIFKDLILALYDLDKAVDAVLIKYILIKCLVWLNQFCIFSGDRMPRSSGNTESQVQ